MYCELRSSPVIKFFSDTASHSDTIVQGECYNGALPKKFTYVAACFAGFEYFLHSNKLTDLSV